MNIYKSFVADTPVNVYWLFDHGHPTIYQIRTQDGRHIRVDSDAYEQLLKNIEDELKNERTIPSVQE